MPPDLVTRLEKARASKDFVGIFTVLGAMIPLESDDARKYAMLREIADIADRMLGDIDAAAKARRAMFEIDPSDVDNLAALARIYRSRAQFRELADLKEREAELTVDTPRRVAILVELEDVYRTRLGDAVKADGIARQRKDLTG